jgi:hypothetical protein
VRWEHYPPADKQDFQAPLRTYDGLEITLSAEQALEQKGNHHLRAVTVDANGRVAEAWVTVEALGDGRLFVPHCRYPVPWRSAGPVGHAGAAFVAFAPSSTKPRTLRIHFRGQSLPPGKGGPWWSVGVNTRPTPATSYPAEGSKTMDMDLQWDADRQVHYGSVTVPNFALSAQPGFVNEATLVAVNVTWDPPHDQLPLWYSAELVDE